MCGPDRFALEQRLSREIRDAAVRPTVESFGSVGEPDVIFACNRGNVRQLNPGEHGNELLLPTLHAGHTATCSRPHCVVSIDVHAQYFSALEVQIAVLTVDSMKPNGCRCPDRSTVSTAICTSKAEKYWAR